MTLGSNKLFLTVSNVKILQPGLNPSYTFDINGGIVGSNDNSVWTLYDDENNIYENHFEIFYIDNVYCVKDLCGHTYINDSDMPLGSDNEAKLQHKDVLRVGDYYIRVKLTEDDELSDSHSLEEFINKSRNILLDDEVSIGVGPNKEKVKHDDEKFLDPIKELDREKRVSKESDDNVGNDLEFLINKNETKKESDITPQADSEFELTSSMRLKRILSFGRKKKMDLNSENYIDGNSDSILDNPKNIESFNMDENNLEILEKELAQTSMQDKSTEVNSHLVMGPLLSGLELQVGNSSGIEDVHKLGEELGESLKACIQGILNIHSQVENGRFGVINRNLQPIEDNPLRLGLNYTETIRTLFDNKKSMVHLSPPAAIEESLNNIRNHNQAMQEATSEALQHILMAFSPEVLLKRFNSYKRTGDTDVNTPESWAWNMYQNYFSELTSNRQRGFDKLFWEIFEQSYDRRIREMQLEK